MKKHNKSADNSDGKNSHSQFIAFTSKFLPRINKYNILYYNPSSTTQFSRKSKINIDNIGDSKKIINILNMISDGNQYNSKLISAILNTKSQSKLVHDALLKIIDLKDIKVKLYISRAEAHKALVIKQDVGRIINGITYDQDQSKSANEIFRTHQSKFDNSYSLDSEIKLLYALHNSLDKELKVIYSQSLFAQEFFRKICNNYKADVNPVKVTVHLPKEELVKNTVVNLLQIIVKSKNTSDFHKKIQDYSRKHTINISNKEIDGIFEIIVTKQLVHMKPEKVNIYKDLIKSLIEEKSNDDIRDCEILNNSNMFFKDKTNIQPANSCKEYISDKEESSNAALDIKINDIKNHVYDACITEYEKLCHVNLMSENSQPLPD